MNFLLRHITDIITSYKGDLPLSVYLKNYQKQFPRLGSRDRKAINEAAYTYYRFASRLPKDLSPFEIIYSGLIQNKNRNTFLEIMLLKHDGELPNKVCPIGPTRLNYYPTLSEGLDLSAWIDSLLIQPDVFIRTRSEKVKFFLSESGVAWKATEEKDCIAVPNTTRLDAILPEDTYVVQDRASQQSVRLLLNSLKGRPIQRVWDTCAGAGGKSLMLSDYLSGVKILASDIRKSILSNLTERFRRYRLQPPQTLVTDVSDQEQTRRNLGDKSFDLILCDVPCSGSGTWARTPEEHYFFDPASLSSMSDRQYRIARNAADYLQNDGFLIYITCSVFADENERVVEKLVNEKSLQVVFSGAINGIPQGSDSMYIAVLRNQPAL